jgi:hypothetical protein
MLAKTLTERQQFWLTHIKASEESNGTVADYARSQQLKIRDIYNWRNKLSDLGIWKPREQGDDFVKVNPVKHPSPETNYLTSCTATFADGGKLELQGDLSESVLTLLLDRLAKSS